MPINACNQSACIHVLPPMGHAMPLSFFLAVYHIPHFKNTFYTHTHTHTHTHTRTHTHTHTHTHTSRLALMSWVQTTPTYHLHSKSTGLPPSVRIRPSQCSLLPPSMLWWGFPSPSTSTPPLLWTTPCPSLTFCSPRKPWLCRAMSRLSPDWEMSKD